MKTTIDVTQSITLTSEEAHWLKGIMQNPLWVDNSTKEDPMDKEMRTKFFNALSWNTNSNSSSDILKVMQQTAEGLCAAHVMDVTTLSQINSLSESQ